MLSANFFEITNDKILSKIKTTPSMHDLMNYICYTHENVVVMDYRYFKYIACENSYQLIINHFLTIIDSILNIQSSFTVCICIKSLTIGDIEKHITFIKNVSNILKNTYENKLDKCYIYKAPFIFSQIYNIISCFIDKVTQQKIVMVDNATT